MHDLLWSLIPWGLEVVAAVQGWAAPAALEPAATLFWRGISALGSAPAYALAILIAAQYGRRPRLARLALLLLVSLYVNTLLKDLAGIPRPYLLAPGDIRAGAIMADSAFPSGHAQMAAAFWGALALARRHAPFAALAAAAVALVALSRLALGVHYPQDVIAGALLGLALAAAGRAGWPAAERRLAAWPPGRQLGVAVAVPVLALAAHPTATVATIAGGAAGLVCGHLLAGAAADYPPAKSPAQALARLGLVAVPAGLLHLLAGPAAAALPSAPARTIATAALYAAMGVLIGGVGPWLWRRLSARAPVAADK